MATVPPNEPPRRPNEEEEGHVKKPDTVPGGSFDDTHAGTRGEIDDLMRKYYHGIHDDEPETPTVGSQTEDEFREEPDSVLLTNEEEGNLREEESPKKPDDEFLLEGPLELGPDPEFEDDDMILGGTEDAHGISLVDDDKEKLPPAHETDVVPQEQPEPSREVSVPHAEHAEEEESTAEAAHEHADEAGETPPPRKPGGGHGGGGRGPEDPDGHGDEEEPTRPNPRPEWSRSGEMVTRIGGSTVVTGAAGMGANYTFGSAAKTALLIGGDTIYGSTIPYVGPAIVAGTEVFRFARGEVNYYRNMKPQFEHAAESVLMRGETEEQAVGNARRELKKALKLDDRRLVDAGGKTLLKALDDAGILNAKEAKLLGRDKNYSEYTYTKLAQLCNDAYNNPDLVTGLRPEEIEFFSRLYDPATSNSERIAIRKKLLGWSAAYGRSIADLHRKFSDCYTIPAAAVAGVSSWLLMGGWTPVVFPLVWAGGRWIYRRVRDAKSDVFEIGPDGSMRDPKDVIATLQEGADDMAGAVRGVRQLNDKLKKTASLHGGHGKEYKDSDQELAEEEMVGLEKKRRRKSAELYAEDDPSEKKRLRIELSAIDGDIEEKEAEVKKIRKALKKQKEEHEKAGKGFWNKAKKIVWTVATEGTTRVVTTAGTVAAFGGAGYGLAQYVATFLPAPLAVIAGGALGTVAGWRLGGYFYNLMKDAASGDKGHHS